MMKTKLAQAITLTLAGGALSLGAASSASAASTVYYNNGAQTRVTGAYDPITNTDGFVWGGVGWRTQGTPPANVGLVNPNWTGAPPLDANSNPLPVGSANFTGLTAGQTPFGYQGSSHMNWAVSLGAIGDTATVSKANAVSTYGTANTANVEVDTGAGAWQDKGNTIQGWRHQTDIGLIRADTDMTIKINIARVSDPLNGNLINDNFGVTVFTGMDTNTGTYSHHGSWNCPTCATPRNYTDSNPFGTTGLTYLTHSENVDTLNSLVFNAIAGQEYSIYAGGAGVGTWSTNVSDYALTVQAVPVPAAVWFFGSALAGLVGFGRRKQSTV